MRRLIPGLAGLAVLASCAGGAEPDAESGAAPDTAILLDGAPAAVAPADAELTRATERLVAFLRGDAPLDTLLLADTVTLHVAPDGGGDSARVSRGALRDRARWRIGSNSLAPPEGVERLTTRVGRHLNCVEGELSSVHPALADRPHVGAMLTPSRLESCLQAWSLTFVFGSAEPRPRLTAVVYDQWEW